MIDQSYLYEIYTFKGNEIYCTYMYVYRMQYKYIIEFKDKITNLSKHLNIGKKKASLVQVLKRREMLSEHNMLKTFRQKKKYIYRIQMLQNNYLTFALIQK